jgi:ABC-2 type transport system ATP-binding protein
VGTDVIVARVSEMPAEAVTALRAVPGVEEVVCRGDELMIHAGDGAGAMSPVALALHASGTRVLSLTLRTPTLDDVFLQLTGAHLEADEATTDAMAETEAAETEAAETDAADSAAAGVSPGSPGGPP